MRINNIPYLFKEGIRGLFAHGFQSASAFAVTVFSLMITGAFICLAFNINIMVDDLNKTNEVIVYISDSLTESDAKSIGTQISNIPNVQNRTFVTREQALEEFIQNNGGEDAFAGVEASDLRHRYVVTLEDNRLMEQTVQEILQVRGVAKVKASYELAEGFSVLQDVLQIASIAVISVLLVVSLLIISNTVKLAMYDRKDEIAIMKMVGATNGFIRLPFVVEGFTLGMIGAAAAFGLLWLLYNTLLDRLAIVDTLKLFSFVPFQELVLPMALTFFAAGLFVGVVGSWTSIRKFMDV